MKYTDFKNAIRRFPVFSSSQLSGLRNDRVLAVQLTQWRKRGLLIRLRKNLYILNENDRALTPSRAFIGNQLYSPSYVSLEYALSFYEMIPERVADVTCVTAKKTQTFSNAFGTFRYQHVKPKCFGGFTVQRDENNLPFFLAVKEKALLDFLYLNIKSLDPGKKDFFKDSMRLQNFEGLNQRKLTRMAAAFKNKKLKKIVKILCLFIAKESR